MTKGASKPFLILAAGAAMAAGVGGYAWFESRRPAVLEVLVFDTPGLPSIFIRTPDDKRILIGGGANADIVRRLTSILPFYSRRLDAIIAPDMDAGNVTGLVEALNRYSVEKAFIPAVTLKNARLASSSDPAYDILLESIRDRAIPVEEFSAGTKLAFGSTVSGSVLFPASATEFSYSKASPPGLCIHIGYGSTSILLIGTASPKIQRFVAAHSSTAADIFPVSVLVSSRSLIPANTARELFSAANPEYVVYSQAVKKAAANKKAGLLAGILFDHRFNIQEKGIVKIVSDGHAVKII